MTPAVEVTTRFATTVEDLPSAWAFVMGRLDLVGPDPSIEINPVWMVGIEESLRREDRDEKPPRHFEVVVSGMVEERAA